MSARPPRVARRRAALLAMAVLATLVPLAGTVHAASTTIVISEVDYDQPSTDTAEFIELFNVSRSSIALGNLAVVLFNGSTTPAQEYARFPLSGKLPPRSIYTIASETIPFLLPGGGAAATFPGSTDQIQNGPADGVAVINTTTFSVIDAIAYEGAISSAQIAGGPVVDLGASMGTDDGAVEDTSLFRMPIDRDSDAPGDWRVFDSTPNDQNCALLGTAGNDNLLDRSKGPAVVCGGPGADVLTGLDGSDLLVGGTGNDTLLGGRGNDVLDGRSGNDNAGFYDTTRSTGVYATLAEGWAEGVELGVDMFVMAGTSGEVSTIENLRGSPFADVLIGDGRPNNLQGRTGDDEIHGGDGNDVLRGMDGADSLHGDAGHDRIQPGAGDDPAVDGGDGADTLDYGDVMLSSPVGQEVDLAASTSAGGSGTDAIVSFQHVIGSPYDDVLSGRVAGTTTVLAGRDGADTLSVDDGDALDLVSGQGGTDACATDAPEEVVDC